MRTIDKITKTGHKAITIGKAVGYHTATTVVSTAVVVPLIAVGEVVRTTIDIKTKFDEINYEYERKEELRKNGIFDGKFEFCDEA